MAVTATASAHAQSAVQDRAAVRAETPWYERFSVSQTPDQTSGGPGPSDRGDLAGWRINGRWAVTVDVSEASERSVTLPTAPGDATSFGAYFQLSPTMRVGGEVSVAPTQAPLTGAERRDQPSTDVRVQSAFRF